MIFLTEFYQINLPKKIALSQISVHSLGMYVSAILLCLLFVALAVQLYILD